MPAAQNQRGRGLGHPCDHLRQRQPCLHVASHGVQQDQHAVHIIGFLQRSQKRQQMLVFCGLGIFRCVGVPLDLPDDGQAMDGAVAIFHHGGAQLNELIHFLLRFLLALLVFFPVGRIAVLHHIDPLLF